ncbi:MFS transporter [Simiduia sp. 21SJ11W-1]|uniref:MFS transporter n=1 Tax=Simiduia sp. 21SJ11W-1 TaxID=2909669 RepID=UPI00209DDAA4|nr:MFS transporter [Simiduia sp. 21SJ11W-1]UTA46643.1 MFS transporter [Simiduia sp. 21SJ11W-1]
MRKKLTSIWPLFFGMLLIGLCVGAQGTLIGLRAALEGFPTTLTGLIMSAYYLGFLLGAHRGQKVIRRVGHVRAFAALTALSSLCVLMHSIYVNPWAWAATRFLTGFAMCGIYLVAESWLNQAADDSNRGKILSLYMITLLGGILGGQFLLNLADPQSFELFSLISILMSAAAIPILVTAIATPVVTPTPTISPLKLFQWAPFGLVGVFLIQMCSAMIFGMAPVYANMKGFNTQDVAWIMASIVAGALLLQWPLGLLADNFNRRIIATSLTAIAALFAIISGLFGEHSFLILLICIGLFGGFTLPLYAVFCALVNDFMRPEKIVAASSTILLVGGVGASIGPILIAPLMDFAGPRGFFWGCAGSLLLISIYGLYRMSRFPYAARHDLLEMSVIPGGNIGTGLLNADDLNTANLDQKPAHPEKEA